MSLAPMWIAQGLLGGLVWFGVCALWAHLTRAQHALPGADAYVHRLLVRLAQCPNENGVDASGRFLFSPRGEQYPTFFHEKLALFPTSWLPWVFKWASPFANAVEFGVAWAALTLLVGGNPSWAAWALLVAVGLASPAMHASDFNGRFGERPWGAAFTSLMALAMLLSASGQFWFGLALGALVAPMLLTGSWFSSQVLVVLGFASAAFGPPGMLMPLVLGVAVVLLAQHRRWLRVASGHLLHLHRYTRHTATSLRSVSNSLAGELFQAFRQLAVGEVRAFLRFALYNRFFRPVLVSGWLPVVGWAAGVSWAQGSPIDPIRWGLWLVLGASASAWLLTALPAYKHLGEASRYIRWVEVLGLAACVDVAVAWPLGLQSAGLLLLGVFKMGQLLVNRNDSVQLPDGLLAELPPSSTLGCVPSRIANPWLIEREDLRVLYPLTTPTDDPERFQDFLAATSGGGDGTDCPGLERLSAKYGVSAWLVDEKDEGVDLPVLAARLAALGYEPKPGLGRYRLYLHSPQSET